MLGAALRQTGLDVLTPVAGWRRIGVDVVAALRQLPTFLAAASSPGILAGTPLALARYLCQSPAALPFAVLSGVALAVAAAVDEATGALPAWEDGLATLLLGLTLGRSVYVALIAERDDVLAANIRSACLRPGAGEPGAGRAPVVAVLGMAHLAGVRAALQKQVDVGTEP